MLPLSAVWTHKEGLPPETGIPGFWDSIVDELKSHLFSVHFSD